MLLCYLKSNSSMSRSLGQWQMTLHGTIELRAEHRVYCVYSCPDRKESNAHAERSCGIVEVVIKSLLYEENLP